MEQTILSGRKRSLEETRAGMMAPAPSVSSPSITLKTVSPDHTRTFLLSFPRNTTCGVSDLRIRSTVSRHLRAIDSSHILPPSSMLPSIDASIFSSQPFLLGARLIALCKNDDDVRPIVVGEILRRLAAKSLLLESASDRSRCCLG